MTNTDLGVKISLLLALMQNVMLSSGLLEITTVFQLSKVRHTRVLALLTACMTSTDVENHVMLNFLRNYNCFPGIRSYTYPFSSTFTSYFHNQLRDNFAILVRTSVCLGRLCNSLVIKASVTSRSCGPLSAFCYQSDDTQLF